VPLWLTKQKTTASFRAAHFERVDHFGTGSPCLPGSPSPGASSTIIYLDVKIKNLDVTYQIP
jgi:hypothetical protein